MTLWRLLTIARDEAMRIAGVADPGDVELDFTLGIPTSFLDVPALKRAFLGFAGLAGRLARDFGPFGHERCDRKDLIRVVKEARAAYPNPEAFAVERMLQAETKAALLWTIRSPAVPSGPFAEIDLGAGTTQASFFRLTGVRAAAKDGIFVFGSVSVDVGMDAVGALLAKPGQGSHTVRGSEAALLGKVEQLKRVRPVLDQMYQAVTRGWAEASKRLNMPPESGNWGSPSLVFCGGGSLVRPVVQRFLEPDKTLPFAFRAIAIEPPRDLKVDSGAKDAVVFLQAAYGLSDPDLEFISLRPPNTIAPMRLDEAPPELRCPCNGYNESCSKCGGTGAYLPSTHAYKAALHAGNRPATLARPRTTQRHTIRNPGRR
jgi:hypothetical protein